MERLLEPAQLMSAPDDVVVVHVGDPAGYQQAHIPDAVLVAPAELVCGIPPATGRLPDADRLGSLFGRLGHSADVRYVAYDDEGGGWAGRFLWTLDVIGHDRWHYLNGGLHAWVADGRRLESGGVDVAGQEARQIPVTITSAPIAEIDDVLAAIRDEGCIWDCRSREEYEGTKRAAQRGGHIPGARHLDWLDLMDRNRALRLREDLETLLRDHGIDPGKPLITHCQTHHRSGLSYLVARLLGCPTPRAYHGSWSEWGNRDDTPIHTGPEP